MSEIKEKICAHELLNQQEESFIAGDLDASIEAAEDFIKSAQELKKIQQINRIRTIVGDKVEGGKRHVVLGS